MQETFLTKKARVLCGGHEISWDHLELATRALTKCLQQISPRPSGFDSVNIVWDMMVARAQHGLNTRPINKKPIHLQLDQRWSPGHVAWQNRNKKCKDDRDNVYAVLSLVSAGNSLGMYVPTPFVPDYTRSVEWVYVEFWAR